MARDRGRDDELPPPPTIGDTVRGFLDDVPETTRGAVDAGRDLYRRGAMAVARTAGDNGALTMLAIGAGIAGLSWLLLRRRDRKPDA